VFKTNILNSIPETSYAFRNRLRFMSKQIDEHKKINILDVGCGTGKLITIPIAKMFKHSNIIGIETHKPSIEYAIEHNNNLKNVEFKNIDIKYINSNKFDVVICSEVLEHLKNPIKMLIQIKRVMKSDGICIITLPNGYGPKENEMRLLSLLKKIGIYKYIKFLKDIILADYKQKRESHIDTFNDESPHINFFTNKSFNKLIDDAEFYIVKRENRRFLSGPFSSSIIDTSKYLANLNVKLAKILPSFLCSSWMFVLKQNSDKIC